MAEAKGRVFTASRGYELADTGPKGEYQVWARFTHDAARSANGPQVFSCATTDPKVVERLLKADDWHAITEVTS